MDACEYNLRMVTIAALVTGSLIYFPLKVHLMLVLRAFFKDKRDMEDKHSIWDHQATEPEADQQNLKGN